MEARSLPYDGQEALVPKDSSNNSLAVWTPQNVGELSVREAGKLLASLWSGGDASGRVPYGTGEAEVWIDYGSDAKFKYSADDDVLSMQVTYGCGKVEIDEERFGKMRLLRNGEVVVPERCDTLSLWGAGSNASFEQVVFQSKAYEWKLCSVYIHSDRVGLTFQAKEDEEMHAWGSVRLRSGEDICCLERGVGGGWCPYAGLAICFFTGEQRRLFRRILGPRYTMLATRIYSVSHSESDVVKTFAITGEKTTLFVDASGKAFKEEVRRFNDYIHYDLDYYGVHRLKF